MLSIRNAVETTFGESHRHEDETHVCQVPPGLASHPASQCRTQPKRVETSEIIPQLLHSDSDLNGFLELVWGLCREPCPATRFKPGNVNEHGQAQRHHCPIFFNFQLKVHANFATGRQVMRLRYRPVQLAMSHRIHPPIADAPKIAARIHGVPLPLSSLQERC